MDSQRPTPNLNGSFLRSGGGFMGERVRAFDWAGTPLGAISQWSAALRITVDQMLASKFPACLFWGSDLIAIYNDGYRPLLGQKPEALGEPMRLTWAEAWADLQPIAEKALGGESTFIEDFQIQADRNGRLEPAWFTFNYGPVFDELGNVVGMLDTVVETTGKILAERQSRQEQERQQSLLKQMPGFVAVLSEASHVFEYVNDAYIAIGGPRNYLGHDVRTVFPELRGQGFYELLDAVYTTGNPFQASAIPIDLVQGGRRYIDLLYTPIRNPNGDVRGIFVGGYDVTDRMTAETELRVSESRLLELNADLALRVAERTMGSSKTWQVSPELFGVINSKGCFFQSNPAWKTLLGWSEAEVARTFVLDFIHPDDLASTKQVWDDLNERGLPALRYENRYKVKGGGWRWLSWVAVPDGENIYCSARDVQEEKQHAAQLAERTAERNVLASIVENTNTQIQVLDNDFNFLAINKATADEYERIYGYRPTVGENLLNVLAHKPDERAAAESLWRRALSGESFVTQAEFGDPAISRSHYELKFEPLRNPGGQRIGAFLSATDITEHRRDQRALQDAQEALRQAQKMEAVGQLTGGIAHDFNNLLTAIGGSLQVLQRRIREGRTDDMERYIEMGESSVRRAAALTHRLLAFSRRQTLDPKPVNINRLATGMADLVRRTVGPSVEVEVADTPDLWPTIIDPSQLENALLNLCINARDAMLPSGGALTIVATNHGADNPADAPDLPPGDWVSLCVTDTGTGMPPEVIARIFDPFYTTKPIGQGTGLGLSMVYGFVRQSGGHVHVDSKVGRGTTLCIYLPRYLGDTGREAEQRAAEAAAAATDGETVLLIEDEDIVREVIQEVLQDAGYRVLAAGDGPTGLQLLQGAGHIDLLVTDVGLPGGMNGRQVADAGRVIRPGLKVLFVTGYAENAAVGNGTMEQGMEVMTKPFEIVDLTQRVRGMLDSR